MAEVDTSGGVDVQITKAKRQIAVNTKLLSDEMFAECIYRGLSDILNSGMSKITMKDLEGEELEKAQQAAFAKAEENLKALLAGEIKAKGSRSKKASKVPTEIKTEALRLAKAAITDQIKADGGKVSHYAKSDITKWAKELLEADAAYYDMAKEELERRKATPIKISLAQLKPSEKLVKKAEEKKAQAKKDKPLSAKQAAMPAPRQKPKPAAHTAH
jgi:hypothetical protein